VDKAPVVASAALVSALHLLANNAEIVKRWINEIQEAAQNKNAMVQVCAAHGCYVWEENVFVFGGTQLLTRCAHACTLTH
jgi:hypothetical protein